jgi:hypothetical protein
VLSSYFLIWVATENKTEYCTRLSPRTVLDPFSSYSWVLGGRIHTNVGTCSYFDAFEYEWSSYFLIWAASKNKLSSYRHRHAPHLHCIVAPPLTNHCSRRFLDTPSSAVLGTVYPSVPVLLITAGTGHIHPSGRKCMYHNKPWK